jgi:hypothetical protein
VSIGAHLAWDSNKDAIANKQSGFYYEQVAKVKDSLTAPPVFEKDMRSLFKHKYSKVGFS